MRITLKCSNFVSLFLISMESCLCALRYIVPRSAIAHVTSSIAISVSRWECADIGAIFY